MVVNAPGGGGGSGGYYAHPTTSTGGPPGPGGEGEGGLGEHERMKDRRQLMSKAAITHNFRKLKTPSRCRECDSYVYFQVKSSNLSTGLSFQS